MAIFKWLKSNFKSNFAHLKNLLFLFFMGLTVYSYFPNDNSSKLQKIIDKSNIIFLNKFYRKYDNISRRVFSKEVCKSLTSHEFSILANPCEIVKDFPKERIHRVLSYDKSSVSLSSDAFFPLDFYSDFNKEILNQFYLNRSTHIYHLQDVYLFPNHLLLKDKTIYNYQNWSFKYNFIVNNLEYTNSFRKVDKLILLDYPRDVEPMFKTESESSPETIRFNQIFGSLPAISYFPDEFLSDESSPITFYQYMYDRYNQRSLIKPLFDVFSNLHFMDHIKDELIFVKNLYLFFGYTPNYNLLHLFRKKMAKKFNLDQEPPSNYYLICGNQESQIWYTNQEDAIKKVEISLHIELKPIILPSSAQENIKLLNSAKLIVGYTLPQMNWLIFLQKTAIICEISPSKEPSILPFLSQAFGIKHYFIRDNQLQSLSQGFSININLLISLLQVPLHN